MNKRPVIELMNTREKMNDMCTHSNTPLKARATALLAFAYITQSRRQTDRTITYAVAAPNESNTDAANLNDAMLTIEYQI